MQTDGKDDCTTSFHILGLSDYCGIGLRGSARTRVAYVNATQCQLGSIGLSISGDA